MNIQDLQGKLVAVLGYGQEGEAVTNYLIKHGVTPVLFDQKPWDKWEKEKQEEIKKLKVNFVFGPDAFKELAGFDLAFRSPGIPLSNPDLFKYSNHPVPRQAGGHSSLKGDGGLQITSQTKWFFDHCPAKIIGVTGTKGKGTTSVLIYEILRQKSQMTNSKYQTYLTGNIGKEQPLDFLDSLTKDDWMVYELSSFQLQDLDQIPHIGVALMLTTEHLDYHRSNQQYRSAKE